MTLAELEKMTKKDLDSLSTKELGELFPVIIAKPNPEWEHIYETEKAKRKFTGFSNNTILFLRNLELNNNKEWFETHKQDYENYLLKPLKELVQDLGFFMQAIDPYIEVKPAINKTISRIYRDTRFSHNKSPYKTTMWVTFKRPNKEWKDAPAFFFEISANFYRYGMGFYSATPKTMEKFRKKIDENVKEFRDVISFYTGQDKFVLEGEKYKRNFSKDNSGELQNWYQRKNFYLVCNREIDNAFFSKKIANDLISDFRLLANLYHFLLNVK